MPYLILALGLIVGVFALYRFFIKATPAQIKTFFRICMLIAYTATMLFFAMTARIFISIGLLFLGIPFVIGYYREKKNARSQIDKTSDLPEE